MAQILMTMSSFYVFKWNFKRMHSSALAMHSWGMMWLTTAHSIRGSYCLRWWHGIIGIKVWNNLFPLIWVTQLFRKSTCRLDVVIQWDLELIRAESPDISSSIYMTNCDQVQVKVIHTIYSTCWILYCWWHVLRAIQTCFKTKKFLKLWALIQDWVYTTEEAEFDTWWKQMQTNTKNPDTLNFIHFFQACWLDFKVQLSNHFDLLQGCFRSALKNFFLAL